MINKKIVIISNITLEPYVANYIKNNFPEMDYKEDVAFVYYETQESLKNVDFVNAAHIIVCLGFQFLFPDYINQLLTKTVSSKDILGDLSKKIYGLYNHIKNTTSIPIIWFGFEDYSQQLYNTFGCIEIGNRILEKANEVLFEMLLKNDIYIDLKRIIAYNGVSRSFDRKNYYRWGMLFSQDLVDQMCKEVHKQLLTNTGISPKCLVLDCDNVLWGGIISEDGYENVRLGGFGEGKKYQEFQRFLVSLFNCGVIITLCSKNYEDDVFKMFKEHTGMLLKERHISCVMINWDTKPNNIKRISEYLNISLDDMVFVDDSCFEIGLVNKELPQVKTINFSEENIYEKLSCFNLKTNLCISDIEKRTDTYKTNIKREILKSTSGSYEEYLNELNMNVDIYPSIDSELMRISQLTQRTNKCTNGKRYTVSQLKNNLKLDNYMLLTVTLKDKFSDMGIVGAIGIKDQTLDLFSLSCRALGRKVEEQMITKVKQLGVKGMDFLITEHNKWLFSKLSKK